jgi:hypothetical protein
MIRSTGWLVRCPGGIVALMLAAGLSAHSSAQVCVEDQYGRVVCGRQVNPNRADPNREAPRYQNPPPERDYGPPPSRESAAPPPRDRTAPPPRDYGPPAERDYGPPPGRESATPPRRDFPPPPRRDFRPPDQREYAPPPGRETMSPPPAERDQGGDPRDFARPYQDNGPRFQRPMRGPNGEPVCPRDFAVQDGFCTPYIRR